MLLAAQIVTALVLLIHVYIVLLETVLFQSRGRKVFGLSKENAEIMRPALNWRIQATDKDFYLGILNSFWGNLPRQSEALKICPNILKLITVLRLPFQKHGSDVIFKRARETHFRFCSCAIASLWISA